MQILKEESETLPEAKDFLNGKLGEKCVNENKSVEEVIQFFVVALFFINNKTLSLTLKNGCF